MAIKAFKDLDVYKLAHELANEIFQLTKECPREEKYSLIDQIRRSSRSVVVNVAEGWGKRRYASVFKRHLTDSNGSLEETKSWLQFALDCDYISNEIHDYFVKRYEKLGAKLWNLHDNWRTF